MAKPAMKRCCCCCGDLRAGTMAILVIESVLAIVSVVALLSSGQNIDGDKKEQTNIEFDMEKYLQTKTSLILHITSSLLLVLFNAIGLYGCYKKSHNFILPCVVYNGIVCLLNIFIILIMAILIGTVVGADIGFAVFVGSSIILGIFVYMWCIVYSYYAVLHEKNDRSLYTSQYMA